jgi:hypothetical protein
MTGDDPATPRFDAAEPRVVATPFGTLDDEHPLRRALDRIAYPATAERVLDLVSRDPEVGPEQVGWFGSVLPRERIFDDAEDVAASLGSSGLRPPTTPPSL